MSVEPTENPFPGRHSTAEVEHKPMPLDPPGMVRHACAAVTCAQCGVPWSLDVRDQPCPMTGRDGPISDGPCPLGNRHLFAQGVTAPEVERLRRIEAAVRSIVNGWSCDHSSCDEPCACAIVEGLSVALEPLK